MSGNTTDEVFISPLQTPKGSFLNVHNGAVSKFPLPKQRECTLEVPGLTKSRSSPDGLISNEDLGSKLVIIMVGLPATGKSFMTNKLSRYLNYLMYDCKAFNVGNYRRIDSKQKGYSNQDSTFFDPKNEKFSKLRDEWALHTLNSALDYLLFGKGSVAIFDATNTTRQRRKLIVDHIKERSQSLQIVFLETICSDPAFIERNVSLKLFGPDYRGRNPEAALADFKKRLENYKKAYQPLSDDENYPYIKMFESGKKITTFSIHGYLVSQTVYYLMNFTLNERQIWLTRNGESEYDTLGKIGGDSSLTERGEKYAKALSAFIDERRTIVLKSQIERIVDERQKYDKDFGNSCFSYDDDMNLNDFFVWTSMRKRSIETVHYFNEVDYPIKHMKMLDCVNKGDYEDLSHSYIKKHFPKEFEKRQQDKLRYRYPGIGGESYMDVINRLRPVINEIERVKDNILIVTHRVATRVLLGYFMNLGKDVIANIDVPLHTVFCLDLKPYGISCSAWDYDEGKDEFIKRTDDPICFINVNSADTTENITMGVNALPDITEMKKSLPKVSFSDDEGSSQYKLKTNDSTTASYDSMQKLPRNLNLDQGNIDQILNDVEKPQEKDNDSFTKPRDINLELL